MVDGGVGEVWFLQQAGTTSSRRRGLIALRAKMMIMEVRSEKDKMIADELYQAFGTELFTERQSAKRQCREFNSTTEDQIIMAERVMRDA